MSDMIKFDGGITVTAMPLAQRVFETISLATQPTAAGLEQSVAGDTFEGLRARLSNLGAAVASNGADLATDVVFTTNGAIPVAAGDVITRVEFRYGSAAAHADPVSVVLPVNITVGAAVVPADLTLGALTPVGTAVLPIFAPDGLYYGGTLRVASNGLTIEPGQTPVVGVAEVGGSTVEVIADRYDVATDAEFDAAFAQTDAALDGITVHARNAAFTRRTIASVHPATSVRLETGGGATLDGIEFTGGNSNFILAPNIQLRAWPATHDGVRFTPGTYTNFTVDGARIRHGYGPDNVDFDARDYPEYSRIDHSRTVTTTSVTHAINWQDPAMTTGQMFIFLEGVAGNAWIAFGDSNVTASVGIVPDADTVDPTYIAIGATTGYERFMRLDPTVHTHFAVITDAGTIDMNFRAEIGLAAYVANGMSAGGGAVFNGLTVRNSAFSQLCNTVGSLVGGGDGETLIMDNTMMGIYQDIWKFSDRPVNNKVYGLRNLYQTPFARPGIDPGARGHAGDPHGDKMFQAFGRNGGPGFPHSIVSAGNVELPSVRPGAYSQGFFGDTKNHTQPYVDFMSIADIMPFCAQRGISIGAGRGCAQWAYVYGSTVFGKDFVTPGTVYMWSSPLAQRENFVGKTVAHSFVEGYLEEIVTEDAENPGTFNTTYVSRTGVDPRGMLIERDNIAFDGAASQIGMFPNIADRLTATTRAAMITAMTPALSFGDVGAALYHDLIDLTTDDYTQVIRWENTHPGVGWSETTDVLENAAVELPIKKLKAGPMGMAVIPGLATEVQILAEDEVTIVSAWTTLALTADRGQFIQMRRNAGAETVTVLASATINGFLIEAQITPANTTTFTTTSAGPYFRDPNPIGSGVGGFTMAATLTLDGTSPVTGDFYGLTFTQSRLEAIANGTVRAFIQDATRATSFAHAASNKVVPSAFAHDVVLDLIVSADLPRDAFNVWINGAHVMNEALNAATDTFRATSVLSLLANSTGGDQIVGEIEDLRFWKEGIVTPTLPASVPHVRVDGNAVVRDALNNDVTAAWTH